MKARMEKMKQGRLLLQVDKDSSMYVRTNEFWKLG